LGDTTVGLDVVEKRKTTFFYRESNPASLVIQHGAQRAWNGPVQEWPNILNIGSACDNFQKLRSRRKTWIA
jgi:hypothetical protein